MNMRPLALALLLALTAAPAGAADDKTTPLPLEELRTLTDVLDRIRRDYVEPVDERTLLESAVRGMLAGLDPHSAYLDPEAYRDLQVGTSGEFGGLGIEVGVEDGFIKIIAPIDDTPAQRAGLRAGDLIVRIDDTPVKGMTVVDAIQRLRGKIGSKVTLSVVRERHDKPFKVTLERAVIQVRSVRARLLEPGYAYARLAQFQARSGQDLASAIDDLRKESGSLKGLILDLRNNPGGVLNVAVEVADLFLDKGVVVTTEGRSSDAQQSFTAQPGDALAGAPMVVLINGGSASASEIVAGALQDHRRAVVAGERSFGKGSVQTVLPLSNGSAVKMTTARYFTPNHRSIQAQGIEPDVRIERLRLASNDSESEPVKEANLDHHLDNPHGSTPVTAPERPDKPEPVAASTSLAQTDNQLHEALNLLKGMNALRN